MMVHGAEENPGLSMGRFSGEQALEEVGVGEAARRGVCRYLGEVLHGSEVRWLESMRRHTTFRIGGQALCLLRPKTEETLVRVLERVRGQAIPHFILGGGSNILLPDDPWDVVAIQLSCCASWIAMDAPLSGGRQRLYAGAGLNLSQLLRFCLSNRLQGLECLVGIPGTVGGALFMNAGTAEGNISDALIHLDVLDEDNRRRRLERTDLAPRYRTLGIPENWVIIGACLETRPCGYDELRRRMSAAMRRRKSLQPLGWPSAGCIFKNPAEKPAGVLIESCGLKGFRIGDAEVSRKHANWIINRGNAKARDVLALIEHIESRVFRDYGIRLEREVRVMVP